VRGRLEHGFRDVVAVLAVWRFDVKRNPRVKGKRAEKLFRHAKIIIAGAFLRKMGVENEKRPSAYIGRGKAERLIHRDKKSAIARNSRFVPKRLRKRLAQNDTGILHRMVAADV